MAFLLRTAATAMKTALAQARLRRVSTPVGVWAGTVTRRGETDIIELSFTRTGKACLVAPGGRSLGTWTRIRNEHFSYRIREALVDKDTGWQSGWIQINQDAAQGRDVFDSSGVSEVCDLNGKLIRSVTTSASARRVSRKEPHN